MARFSDAQLIQILIKAGRRINRRLCLFGTDDEITVDNSGNITSPANDGALEDLVLLQAECMITQREFIDFLDPDSIAAGVLVTDGEQTIDTRAAGSARGNVFNSSISPCAELNAEIVQEKMSRSGNGFGSGKLIW